MSLPQCQHTFFVPPATPKHFSCHSRYAKTLFLPLLPRQNTVLPFQPRQNIFLAASATPKHFFCPFCIAKNTSWSQPVTARQHLATAGHLLATTGHHLATPGHHLATPGNQNGRHSDQNCSLYIVAPPTKFKFPALFTCGEAMQVNNWCNSSCCSRIHPK